MELLAARAVAEPVRESTAAAAGQPFPVLSASQVLIRD